VNKNIGGYLVIKGVVAELKALNFIAIFTGTCLVHRRVALIGAHAMWMFCGQMMKMSLPRPGMGMNSSAIKPKPESVTSPAVAAPSTEDDLAL
jgi:hypothetical protein